MSHATTAPGPAAASPLFAVRDALRELHAATAGDIAARLRLPEAVVEDLLGHWTRRGLAERREGCASGACSSCRACAGSVTFHWRAAAGAVRLVRTAPVARGTPA